MMPRTTFLLMLVPLAAACDASMPAMPLDLSSTPLADMTQADCNQVPLPTATITIQQGMGMPPSPLGGSVVDGTYVLTQSTDYNVGDALVGQPTAGEMIVTGGAIQTVSKDAKGGTVRVNASYLIMGTSLQQTGTCGFSESFSQGFTATSTTITLIQPSPPIVDVFTRQ
jgi:hypothetical protein